MESEKKKTFSKQIATFSTTFLPQRMWVLVLTNSAGRNARGRA